VWALSQRKSQLSRVMILFLPVSLKERRKEGIQLVLAPDYQSQIWTCGGTTSEGSKGPRSEGHSQRRCTSSLPPNSRTKQPNYEGNEGQDIGQAVVHHTTSKGREGEEGQGRGRREAHMALIQEGTPVILGMKGFKILIIY